jgi:non-ribosomal peptide synthase protein (TIGR01720 family)
VEAAEEPVAGALAATAPSASPVPTSTPAAHGVGQPAAATPVPLTPIQHWFFDQRFADPEHWNQAFAFRLIEPVTAVHLEAAWTWLVSQHPALRQCFERDAHGQWHPSAAAGAVAPVVNLSVAALSDDAARAVVEERATEAQAGLSFERGPLARLLRVDAGPGRPAWLVLVVHHLVVDGVSWRVLREDLEAAVLAIRRGGLPPERPASADMSAWACALQAEARESAVLAEWPHWQRVAGCAPWQVPRGRGPSGPVVLTRRLSPQATSTLLRQLPLRGRVSVPGALLATLAAALHASTGRRDWRLDLEGHGREPLQGPGASLDVSRTVGWFTTLFPHTLVLSDGATPLAAAQATQTALDAVPRKGLGYGLLRWLAADPEVRHALARQPASPLLFNYLGQWDAVLAGSELMRFAQASTGPWRSPQAHRSHALELLVMVREGVLSVEASHDARQVDGDWVASLLDTWARELQLLVRELDAPDAAVAAAPLPVPVPSEPVPLPVDTAVQGPPLAAEAPPARAAAGPADALARPASTMAEPAGGSARLPVTPLQQLFMAVHGASDDPGLQQWQFVLDGDLSPLRMRQALQQVVRRHGILRTAFLTDALGEPGQQVLDSATVPWRDEDWSAIAAAEQERRLAIGLAADRATPMRLDQPPLMRVWLIARGAGRWHLVWTTHHLILDGWSWPLLMAEWSRACTSLAQARLPDEGPPLQFADYVQWLVQDWPRHGEPESRAYWARQLRGVTAPTPVGQPPLPADAAVDAAADAAGDAGAMPARSAERVRRLSPGSGSALVQKARRWRVTPGTLMLAAWAAVLAHRADELDIVLGCTLSGRPAELDGIESLVGPCVNNVPLVLTLQPSQTLQAWLGQLQLAQQDAVQHQYLGLEAIQQLSDMPWKHRLFDSLLVFQNYPMDADARQMGEGVRCEPLAVPQATPFSLTLAVQADADPWSLHLMGRGPCVPPALLAPLLDELVRLLEQLAAAGGQETVGEWLQHLPPATRGWARRLPAAVQRPMAAPLATSPNGAGPHTNGHAPAASHGQAGAATPGPAPIQAPGHAQGAAMVAPASSANGGAAPAQAVQTALVEVWCELLGVADVPLDTNFFEMGVQSLQLVRAHRLLQQRLARPLRLLDMVTHPTVRQLAQAWGAPAPAAPGHPLAAAAAARARRWRSAQRPADPKA